MMPTFFSNNNVIRLSRGKSEHAYLMETSAKVLMEQVNFLSINQLACNFSSLDASIIHDIICIGFTATGAVT